MSQHTCMVGGTGGRTACPQCKAETRALREAIDRDRHAERVAEHIAAERAAIDLAERTGYVRIVAS